MKICACTKNMQEMKSDPNISADKSSLTPFTLEPDPIYRMSVRHAIGRIVR